MLHALELGQDAARKLLAAAREAVDDDHVEAEAGFEDKLGWVAHGYTGSLASGEPPVDDQGGPGDVARCVAREKERGGRDLVGLRHPLQRRAGAG